ncbi:hypothetical protein KPL40_04290 [Clostridium gasigenes]|uniref:hypothetical protein n=1 Tax=Clostridium gasigenes TaxID=94869 RepID=UPI001C0C263B|nr:hypothetical protein [Clostridium gasigenes]MBU3131661.1 hypothetical protein [Clostridium gasigenes]
MDEIIFKILSQLKRNEDSLLDGGKSEIPKAYELEVSQQIFAKVICDMKSSNLIDCKFVSSADGSIIIFTIDITINGKKYLESIS